MRQTSFSLIFAATFSAAYFFAVIWNLTLFTYHPAIPDIGWGMQPPKDGPAMYWYGWIASATMLGLVATFVASFLPRSLLSKCTPDLAWIAPCATILAFGWLLRGFFMKV